MNARIPHANPSSLDQAQDELRRANYDALQCALALNLAELNRRAAMKRYHQAREDAEFDRVLRWTKGEDQ